MNDPKKGISNRTYSFVAAIGKLAVRGIDRREGWLDSFLYTSVAPGSWNMHPESQCASDPFRLLPEVRLGSTHPATIE
ncbi:hypothetical protein [Paenibacillus thiaminolyticus]|uniref:hypothetical protein n=1 Tax=Paenibacillus thiaminolyticus TaxID=49283 RepID=UPI0011C3B606|nr:hypothetical protein [Paenibacillus thiaminolyticus]